MDPDEKLENANWPKRHWDLIDVDSVEKLRARLKRHGITIEAFKRLPVYLLNVDRVPWLRKL